MSIRSGDIRDQSRKLTEIAPNFGRFLPSQILLGAPLPKLVSTSSRLSRGTLPDVTPPSNPKVIGAHMWNFKPILMFALKIFRETRARTLFVVCASKPW